MEAKNELKNKSKKQIAYERELEEVRQSAAQEYEANIAEIERLLNTPENELTSDQQFMASWYRLHGYNDPDEKNRRIRERIESWESSRKISVTGEYRDEELLKAQFQQAFVSYFQKSKPDAFKELESLSGLYTLTFEAETNSYLSVFDFQLREALLSADDYLTTVLETLVFRHPQLGPFSRYIKIRPRTYTDWDEEFILGDFHLFTEFLHAYLSSSMCDREEPNATLSDMLFEEIRFETNSDEGEGEIDTNSDVLVSARKLLAEYLITNILRVNEPEYAFTHIQNRIPHIVNLRNSAQAVAAFVELHTKLLRWTKLHGLCKDWLLKYAYFFVGKKAETSEADLTTIPVPISSSRRLYTDKFRFEFDPWIPDGTSREEHERRLRAAFNIEVERFFQRWGRDLNLDEFGKNRVKSKTRSFDPEFESVKWLLAWNEGATRGEIAMAFNREDTVIRDGLKSLRKFSLPIRSGTPGRRKTGAFSVERLREIKALKL